MTKHYPLLIAGAKITNSDTVEIRSPFDNQLVGITYQASPPEIIRAINSASESFSFMKKLPAYQRAEILINAAAEIKARQEEIAQLITLEAGKPIKASRVEASRAANTFTLAAEESKRLTGDYLPLDVDASSIARTAIITRFPVGVVSAITPFNFPLNLVAHKLAPAMAVGNPVVLKPAPQTPLTALTLGDILLRAGWPREALSVVVCRNEDAAPLIVDPKIKMLSFTGSAGVGWHLKKLASDKKVVLELGGNAGVIVDSDADLDFAVARCVFGSFSYSGQICISVQRIYVHQSVYQDFIQRFLEGIKKLKIGNPLDENVDLGSMISEREASRTEAWVKEACQQGAKLLYGGNRQGTLFEPTVLTNVDREMKVCCQEVFAPVVTIDSYNNFEEALELINNSAYGLQAGVFTRDMKKVFQAYNQLDVGGIIVGDIPTYRAENMPYGGVKQSGFGREGIRYSIEEMTELKTLVLNLS